MVILAFLCFYLAFIKPPCHIILAVPRDHLVLSSLKMVFDTFYYAIPSSFVSFSLGEGEGNRKE